MDGTVEVIVSLIGSLGFPIVCCFFLWKYINETMKEFTKTMTENTMMLSKLCEKLDVDNDRKDDDKHE